MFSTVKAVMQLVMDLSARLRAAAQKATCATPTVGEMDASPNVEQTATAMAPVREACAILGTLLVHLPFVSTV